MMRAIAAAVAIGALLASPSVIAQDIGTLCTSEETPANRQIEACTKIIASKQFSGAQLATVYFWRAVGHNKKGDYNRVIADTTESLRIQPGQVATLNLRGSAFFDKGEYDIAIADFSDALRIGPPNSIVHHNRGNAFRHKDQFEKAIADYTEAIRLEPRSPFSLQNRGAAKQALGDLDGALTDINEAIRISPGMPSTLNSRAVLWRARGEYDRAIADATEAIRLVDAKVPVPTLTPPGSLKVGSYFNRAQAREAKGEFDRARSDYTTALGVKVADVSSVSAQASARARLAALSELQPAQPSPPATRPGPSAPGQTAAPSPTSAPTAAPVPPPAPVPAGKPERRIALVIGNSAYANVTRLNNPANDARTIAKNLRDIGFEVTEGYDLDRARLQRTSSEFLRNAIGAKVAVLFYSGHGISIDGKNFMVPVDAKTDSPQALVGSLTNVENMIAGLDDQIRTNVFILDACRNNPMAGPPQGGRGLTISTGLTAPTGLAAGALRGAGTLIAFATAPGQVALDGEGANSPFSEALARHIGTPGLEVQQMLTRVRADVVAATKNKQVPWSNSALLGEVYLAGVK